MDERAQADGEKRVREFLIDPLRARGLGKPTHLTRAEFETMLEALAAKLAYLSKGALIAVEEEAASKPGGKTQDRFPIANVILGIAARIEPPQEGYSPLVRRLFAHATGQAAVNAGWGPELLAHVRKVRVWPQPFALRQIENDARSNLLRAEGLRAARSRGADLSEADAAWLAKRDAVEGDLRGFAAGEGAA